MNRNVANWLAVTRQQHCHLNVGFGFEYPISTVSSIVADTIRYKGHCVFNAFKPDGTQKK